METLGQRNSLWEGQDCAPGKEPVRGKIGGVLRKERERLREGANITTLSGMGFLKGGDGTGASERIHRFKSPLKFRNPWPVSLGISRGENERGGNVPGHLRADKDGLTNENLVKIEKGILAPEGENDLAKT